MGHLKVWYDKESDYLEVTFENVPAALEELDEDIFERRTPDGRVIGFAIFNFSKHEQSTLSLPLVVTAVPFE